MMSSLAVVRPSTFSWSTARPWRSMVGMDARPDVSLRPPGLLRPDLTAWRLGGDISFMSWSCTISHYLQGRPRGGCRLFLL